MDMVVWWVRVFDASTARGGCAYLMLLQPKVPRSKIAAGHVGVVLQTSSCQVGMQNLQINLVQISRGMAYKGVERVSYLILTGT